MKGTDKGNHDTDRDALTDLFAHASARERPSPEEEAVIRSRLHAQWQAMTAKRKRNRQRLAFAAAATITLAVLMTLMFGTTPQPQTAPTHVADLEKVQGSVWLAAGANTEKVPLDLAVSLVTGQTLVSGFEARLAFRWHNGILLRMDQSSEIRIVSPHEIALESGRLYIDTDSSEAGGDAFTVLTPAGAVRHVGTRYMTSVSFGTTSVSVRDGLVLLGDADEPASGGTRLVVDASGQLKREMTPIYGDRWAWTETLVGTFPSEGRSLSDFLAWTARETGRRVAFGSVAAEQRARSTRLSGDIDLPPMDALPLVMRTTDLTAETRAGVIFVALDPAP